MLDRPYAFKQWVDKYLDKIPGEAGGMGWECVAGAGAGGRKRRLQGKAAGGGPFLCLCGWAELHEMPVPLRYHIACTAENYIWMGEPDHVFIRPPPLWATPER